MFYQQRVYLYEKASKARKETLTTPLEVYEAETAHMQESTPAFTEVALGQHVQIVDLRIQR